MNKTKSIKKSHSGGRKVQIVSRPSTATSTSSSDQSFTASPVPDDMNGSHDSSFPRNIFPNIDHLSYSLKSIVYEMKELAIRILSLLKIEINLNLYEKQKLHKLILNFNSSMATNLQSSLESSRSPLLRLSTFTSSPITPRSSPGYHAAPTSLDCLYLTHYFLALIISLKLPYDDLFTTEIDHLIFQIIQENISRRNFSEINSFTNIFVHLLPQELLPKSMTLLIQISDQKFDFSIYHSKNTSSTAADSPPSISPTTSTPTPNLRSSSSWSSSNLLLLFSSMKSSSSKSFSRLNSLFRSSSRIQDYNDNCADS